VVVFTPNVAACAIRSLCASSPSRAASAVSVPATGSRPYPKRKRARSFDLRRPGLLRVALLDGPEPCTDVLLTYHRVLLDSWSVRLLMRECCRRYLVGGVLPGCERRPDFWGTAPAGWAGRTSGRPATSGDGSSTSIRIRPRSMAPGSTMRPAGTAWPGQAEGQGRRHGSPRRVCQAGGQPNQFTVPFSEV
jgi:hypothetical protein